MLNVAPPSKPLHQTAAQLNLQLNKYCK